MRKRYTVNKMLGLIAFAAFCLYLVVPLGLFKLADQIVLIPFPATPPEFKTGATIDGIAGQNCTFATADGSTLFGWFFKKPGADKVIIFHHGNAGNIAHRLSIASLLLAANCSVFLYDYRGYGKSEGKATVAGLPEDGDAAYKFVTEQLHILPSQIIQWGESIGSGVACIQASTNKCAGLILEAPISSLPMVGRIHFPFLRPYPDFLFPQPQFNNVQQIKQVQVPLLIIHGGIDTLVPPSCSKLIFDQAKQPKRYVLLPHSDHNNFGDDLLLFRRSVDDFVKALPLSDSSDPKLAPASQSMLR